MVQREKLYGISPEYSLVLNELPSSINGGIIGVRIPWTVNVTPFVWTSECLCSLVALRPAEGVIMNNQLKIAPLIFF